MSNGAKPYTGMPGWMNREINRRLDTAIIAAKAKYGRLMPTDDEHPQSIFDTVMWGLLIDPPKPPVDGPPREDAGKP